MTGMEWLAENRAQIMRLAASCCHGDYSRLELLWDVAVDKVPRMIDVLWDEERPLWPYLSYNLRWYFFKAINKSRAAIRPGLTVDPEDPDYFPEKHESEEWVSFIMDRLTDEESELITLHVLNGRSFQWISFKTGLLRETVYRRYNLALERVRELADLDG